MKLTISHIVAIDENNAIGKNNQLLWHLPDDFKWFKENTLNKPIIMGKNTMISIGKPLPKRKNIVITSSNLSIDGYTFCSSVNKAIEIASNENNNEIMIIGGAKLYKSTIDLCNKIYVTKVKTIVNDADVFYPAIDLKQFKKIFQSDIHTKDEKHLFEFYFEIYERI